MTESDRARPEALARPIGELELLRNPRGGRAIGDHGSVSLDAIADYIALDNPSAVRELVLRVAEPPTPECRRE